MKITIPSLSTLCFSAILPLLSISIAITTAIAHAETPHVSIGRVVSTGEGAVGVQSGFSGELHTDDPLVPDERIETGLNSVTLLLREGTISAAVKIKPHSRIKLVALAGQGIQVTLESGAVLSDVHNPEKRPHPYEIKTRTAAMGVRGTVFFVKEQPGQFTFLCTCHGQVALSRIADKDPAQATVIESKHHDHPVMIREVDDDSAMSTRTMVAVKGDEHTDQEAADLEKVLSSLK